MGLIGNQSVLHKSLARFTNGTSTAGAYAANLRSNFNKPSILRSRDISYNAKDAIPTGYAVGTAIRIPRSSGGISAFTTIAGTSSLTATAILAKLSSADISGTGSVSAALSVITQGEAAIAGTSSISATLLATSGVSASLAGTSSVTANISATVPVSAMLAGTSSLSVNLTGIGRLEADITPFTELSPQSLASAVLNSDIETDYNLQAALRLILSATAGKVSGAETTTVTIRNVVDDKDRIIATVDVNGNRTSLTYDVGD